MSIVGLCCSSSIGQLKCVCDDIRTRLKVFYNPLSINHNIMGKYWLRAKKLVNNLLLSYRKPQVRYNLNKYLHAYEVLCLLYTKLHVHHDGFIKYY